MSLECEESEFSTELTLTNARGRIVLDGEEAGPALRALFEWLGEYAMVEVNDWYASKGLPRWRREDHHI